MAEGQEVVQCHQTWGAVLQLHVEVSFTLHALL